ncbi:tetratricopeptide repeat protein [Desulfonatronum thioautotrophicum]|uniref:tetratricopeptide repeat protein n=1 Tax=Desulfonatronum thioautotrophicum TaxID=617001 RepID=UPI0005EADB50|nr:hypothetical protein [Desulfonatronum thioautotrophicum]
MSIGRFILTICILLLSLLFIGSALANGAYPKPEKFLEHDDPAGYAQAAMDFLAENPDSAFAPRVAFDLLMVATVFHNTQYADMMTKLMVLDYAQSLQARYFRSTFPDADSYRALLARALDEFAREPNADFPAQYAHGLGFALDDFGDQLLTDADFLLKSAYVLGAAGEAEAKQDFLARLAPMVSKDDELGSIMALAAGAQKNIVETTRELHAISGNNTALFLRDLFLFLMTETERETPAMRQVAAEAYIEAKRFRDALPILERQALEEHGEKIVFQRAWSHAALGEREKALSLLRQLDDHYPDSPWRVPGSQLTDALEQYDVRLEAFTEALLTLTATATDLDAFEGRLFFTPEGSAVPMSLYLALSMENNFLEAQLRREDALKYAYKTSPEGSMLFVKGDNVMHRFLEPGPAPSFKLDLQRDMHGRFQLDLSASLVDDLQDIALSNRTFLESPYLTTREGAMELMQYTMQSGYFLGEIIKTDEQPVQTRLTLVMLDARDPGATASGSIILNDIGQLVGLEMKNIVVRDVQYGESSAVTFSPPEWPLLDVVESREFNIGYFFNILGNLAQLFMEQED